MRWLPVEALGANDSVDWGQLGGDDTFAPNPSSVVSALGATFTVTKTQATPFLRANEGGLIYHGDFTPGDHLITTNDQSNNPNFIVLQQGLFVAAGAQIEADAQGPFTARITAFNALGDVLASFTAAGSANPTGPGTGFAPFLGIVSLDNTPFARVGFDITAATGDSAFFAINTISLKQVPEPSTFAIGAAGMFGLVFLARRRRPISNGIDGRRTG